MERQSGDSGSYGTEYPQALLCGEPEFERRQLLQHDGAERISCAAVEREQTSAPRFERTVWLYVVAFDRQRTARIRWRSRWSTASGPEESQCRTSRVELR